MSEELLAILIKFFNEYIELKMLSMNLVLEHMEAFLKEEMGDWEEEDYILPVHPPSNNTIRVYLDDECETLTIDCRRFLLSLEQQGMIDASLREWFITKALEYSGPFTLDEFKRFLVFLSDDVPHTDYPWMKHYLLQQGQLKH